jgi:hypothetical protein
MVDPDEELTTAQLSHVRFVIRTRNANGRVACRQYSDLVPVNGYEGDMDDEEWKPDDVESGSEKERLGMDDSECESDGSESEGETLETDGLDVGFDPPNLLPLWSAYTHPKLNQLSDEYYWLQAHPQWAQRQPLWILQLDLSSIHFEVSLEEEAMLKGEVGLLFPVCVVKELLERLLERRGYELPVTRDCVSFFHRFLEFLTVVAID